MFLYQGPHTAKQVQRGLSPGSILQVRMSATQQTKEGYAHRLLAPENKQDHREAHYTASWKKQCAGVRQTLGVAQQEGDTDQQSQPPATGPVQAHILTAD